MLSDEEARRKVEAHAWFHSFELRPGLVTLGRTPRTDARMLLSTLYTLPEDLSGLTALDVGALDGPYAFELERRGAQVTALDIQHPDVSGFNIAKEVLCSRVEYVQGNVYEAARLLAGRQFDVITYLGVWYHLKHPVRAFEQLHAVLKDSGLLLIEGEFLHHYAEAPGRSPQSLRREAKALGKSELPVSLFYGEGWRGDPTSWVIPNLACLKQWLSAASLELEDHRTWTVWPNQRLQGRVRKTPGRAVPVDNPAW